MDYSSVVTNWEKFVAAVKRVGGQVPAFTLGPPMPEAEVAALEQGLGFALPVSFREVLLNFSGQVEYRWLLPDDFRLQGELAAVFSGGRHWSSQWLLYFNEQLLELAEDCFPDPDDVYDAPWHTSFAFHCVGNGDYLAIDLKDARHQPVIYLNRSFIEG